MTVAMKIAYIVAIVVIFILLLSLIVAEKRFYNRLERAKRKEGDEE